MAPAIAPTIAGPHIGERVREVLCLAFYLAPRRRLSHEALAAERAHAARIAVGGHACGAVDDPWDAHLSCNAMASTSMDVVWVPSVPWHAQLDTKSDTPSLHEHRPTTLSREAGGHRQRSVRAQAAATRRCRCCVCMGAPKRSGVPLCWRHWGPSTASLRRGLLYAL